MSAPARACASASPPAAERRSLSTSSPSQHAAVAVVGVLAEADVGDEQQVGRGAPDGLERRGTMPSGSMRLRADARPSSPGCRTAAPRARRRRRGDGTPPPPGRPRAARPPACSPTGARRRVPGTTNSGWISCAAVDVGLAHQPAQRFAAPQPPRAVGGEATHRPSGLRRSCVGFAKMLHQRRRERRARCSRRDRRRPTARASRAVSAVTGPMQATTGAREASAAARGRPASTKCRTVELLVKVTASTRPAASAARSRRRRLGRGHGPIGDHLVDRRAARAPACPAGSPRARRARQQDTPSPQVFGRRARRAAPRRGTRRARRAGRSRCRPSSAAVSGPIAASRTPASARTSRPSAAKRSKNVRTPLSW